MTKFLLIDKKEETQINRQNGHRKLIKSEGSVIIEDCKNKNYFTSNKMQILVPYQ